MCAVWVTAVIGMAERCGSLPLRRTAGLAGQEMQEIKFHYGECAGDGALSPVKRR